MANLNPSDIYLWLGNVPIIAIMLGNLAYSDGLKYAEQNLVGRKPTLQCTGENLRKITSLQLHLDGAYCDVEDYEKMILELAKKPEAYPLILECGKIIGDFVVTSIKTNYRQTDPHGNPISADYTLALSEYIKPQADVTKKDSPAVKDKDKKAAKAQQKSKQTPKTQGNKAKTKATTSEEIVRKKNG